MNRLIIKSAFTYIAAAGILFILNSCRSDDPDPGGSKLTQKVIVTFNHAIDELAQFEQPQELSEPEILSQEEPNRDTEDKAFECYTTNYKAAPGFDEMLTLDPTTDVIYPGALVKGESIPTGEYLPIIADRDSITLSISLTNIGGSPVVKIGNPKLSTVREGVKKILDQEVNGATEAKINYEISEVHSKEQLNLALGVNYRSVGNKVSSSFDFASTTYQYKYIFKFLQVYYTIDMDIPANPSELFNTLPDLDALGSTSPVYVSTVTYGRMIIYTIESNYSKTEIDAAFSASVASGDGSVDAKSKSVLNESNIKALVIGGSGDAAAQTVAGPEQVFEYISTGGDYSKDSPGAALSYKLRYLKDNAVARVVLSSEYVVRTCDLAYPVYEITLERISCSGCKDAGGSSEIYGGITAYASVNGKRIGFLGWEVNRDGAISVPNNGSKKIGIKPERIELYRPDYSQDFIYMGARLKEKDLTAGGDDDFASVTASVPLKDIKPPGIVELKTNGSKVRVKFVLKRIR